MGASKTKNEPQRVRSGQRKDLFRDMVIVGEMGARDAARRSKCGGIGLFRCVPTNGREWGGLVLSGRSGYGWDVGVGNSLLRPYGDMVIVGEGGR